MVVVLPKREFGNFKGGPFTTGSQAYTRPFALADAASFTPYL
jgi:hypothetical protein